MILSKLNAARIAYGVDRAVQAHLASPTSVVVWERATNAVKTTWLQYISAYNTSGTVPTLGSDAHRTSAFQAVVDVLIPRNKFPGRVQGVPASFTLDATTYTHAHPGTHQIVPTALDSQGDPASGHFTYSSSVPAKATVSAAGLITTVAAGTTTITVTETKSGIAHTVAVTVS